MRSFDSKKILPHLAIIGIIAVISFLFCFPVLKGLVLSQSDNVSWKAAAHEAMAWHERTGENTLWSNSMFGGMPTFTFYVAWSNNYIKEIQTLLETVLSKPVYFFFVAMACFYALMCTLKINRWLGLAGAIAFAFATYNPIIIAVGHESKMLTMAFVPLVISALIITYRGNYFYGGVLSAFAFALFVWGHLQIIYYMIIVLGLIVLVLFIIAVKAKQLKRFFIASAVTALAYTLGIGPSVGTLLSVQEYSKYTMRGGQSELTFNHDQNKPKTGGLDKDYAFQWSNGIGETFCILIPYLYGGSGSEPLDMAPQAGEIMQSAGYNAVPMYWGPQPFLAGPMYFGAIVCFLFVLGLMVVDSPHKWWILAASLLGIVMSWGKFFSGFNYFLFDYLPFYNKFRSPSTALAIAQMLFPVLGVWGVMEILRGKEKREEYLKKIKIALGITVGLCLLLGFGGSMFFDFTNATESRYPQQLRDALIEDRAELAMKSALRSAIFILLTGGLLWAFVKDRVKMNIVTVGLVLLISADVLPVAANYLNEENYEEPTDYETAFQPRPVDEQIMQDPDPHYRVLDLSRDVYADAIQAYFHKCIGGYSPAKMEVYQDLIDVHMSKTFNTEVLNMMNTKYIIYNDSKNTPVAQMNNTANGNAWFVDSIQWAKTADEEILSMRGPVLGDTAIVANPWNSKSVAIVRESHRDELGNYSFGKDSAAQIRLTKYGLNDMYYESSNNKPGLGVFSEVYYEKGWEAYIDGKQVPITRIDWLLRAIKIPAGNHKIEFHFRPKTWEKGEAVALVASITLYILGIVAIILLIRGKKPFMPAGDK